MQRAFGLDVPQTLEEVCTASRTALLVYDMQVGVFEQAPTLKAIVPQVEAVLEAARAADMRVFFCRHMSAPKELMGVSQLRTAMAWQRLSDIAQISANFLRTSPGFALLPEIQPKPSELVFDKIGMSAFVGTPLDMLLRDCNINSLIIVGAVLEIGIMPSISNGIDLGHIPIVVTDACGSVDSAARERSLADLEYTGTALTTSAAVISKLLRSQANKA